MNDRPDDQTQSTDSTPANFETERTQARKVVQGLTQAVIQWMPLGGSAELMRAAAQNELRIWDLLAQIKQYPAFSRMAILAWGDYGKTTLLRHITYTYCQDHYRRYKVPKFLPVLLHLRKWQEVIATEQNLDLPRLIEQHHLPSLPEGAGLQLPPQ